jgi:hypothetical protein
LLLDPEAITGVIGRAPTASKTRFSERGGHAPTFHLWEIQSGIPDTRPLDDHWEALMPMLEPYSHGIRRGIDESFFEADFRVGRHMEPGPEDPQIIEPGAEGEDWVRLGGQHPLLGFLIDPKLVRLAAACGIGFNFDEYGDE